MQGLKFILLSSALCLNLLAFDFSTIDDWTYTTSVKNSFLPVDVSASPVDAVVLDDQFLQIGDDVYSYTGFSPVVFNVELLKNNGFFLENKSKEASKKLFHYGGFEQSSVVCQMDGSEYLSCSKHDYDDQFGKDPSFKSVNFSYYLYTFVSFFRSCKSNETFDPDSKQCYHDCSKDGGINKIGLPNGGCIDCSGEKDSFAALRCLCLGSNLGFGGVTSFWGKNGGSPDDCDLQGTCLDGSQISFSNPKCNEKPKPDPKPDENKTKPDDPKPNPNPGGGSGGGNGGGGGGNNGGSQDNPNPNSGGGESQEKFCNEHPKDPKCKKGNKGEGNTTIINNNGGGGNGNNKDGEAKFNKSDFDDGDLDKERSGLYNGIAKHINDNFSKFDGIREGVDQFIKNVQGKGFETVKTSIKSKCPMKKEIPLPNGGSKDITVDLCEYVSPVSEISYYAFYVGFAVGGFLLFLKLLIFSF